MEDNSRQRFTYSLKNALIIVFMDPYLSSAIYPHKASILFYIHGLCMYISQPLPVFWYGNGTNENRYRRHL